MDIELGGFNIRLSHGQTCVIKEISEKSGVILTTFNFCWTKENADRDDSFIVGWFADVPGVMYKWDACCRLNRDLSPHWDDRFNSMLSSNSPVTCYFDGADTNRYCWAVSECSKLVEIKNGLRDQTGSLKMNFSFGTKQFTNQYEMEFTLYTDTRLIPMRKAVEGVASWWEEECGMTPLTVPEDAREPLYSFWYSYHQDVNESAVEEECRRAKELGFSLCIIDDGWQTEDNNGSYPYCGDWLPVPSKFPDMASHVRRVHEIGMKYILWYSLPLIGYRSAHYEKFKDMLLRDEPGLSAAVLDPRYKQTREFLIQTFRNALTEWNLDGFKMDFIDSWRESSENVPYNSRMDIPALQDAVNTLMSDIVQTLTQIKPDILIEFRQSYIGPHMKRFGNLFRVGDCAGDYLKNRASILDLRMLMGNRAVHSDMLMMAPFEDPRINALQIISCMFGVMQFSGRLNNLDEKALKMSRFWLNFLKEHKALLQSKNLSTYEAHLLYTWAKAVENDECAVGVYAVDKVVKPDEVSTIYIANGCMGERIFIELSGAYRVVVFDCFGEIQNRFEINFDGVNQLSVPVGGLIEMRKIY
ncbi:MAG: alpha-galactosidase [Clostridiales bacterium]|nr:alpha-galactosidase [Clostridiales bacterium]